MSDDRLKNVLDLFSQRAKIAPVEVVAPESEGSGWDGKKLLRTAVQLALVGVMSTQAISPAAAQMVSHEPSINPITISINGKQTNYLSNADSIKLSKEVAKDVGLASGWRLIHAVTRYEHNWDLEAISKCFPEVGDANSANGIRGLVTAVALEVKEAEDWVASTKHLSPEPSVFDASTMNGLNAKFISAVGDYYHGQMGSCNTAAAPKSARGIDFVDAVSNFINRDKSMSDYLKPMAFNGVSIESKTDSLNQLSKAGGYEFSNLDHLGVIEGVNVVMGHGESKMATALAHPDSKTVMFTNAGFKDVVEKYGSNARNKEFVMKALLWHEIAHINDQPEIPLDLRAGLIAEMENIADASSVIRLLQDGYKPSELLSWHAMLDSMDRSSMHLSPLYEQGDVTKGYVQNDTDILRLLTQNTTVESIIKGAIKLREDAIDKINRVIAEDTQIVTANAHRSDDSHPAATPEPTP